METYTKYFQNKSPNPIGYLITTKYRNDLSKVIKQ